MSKYYKAEDVINKVAEYISIDYSREERAREDAELLFADLPTIEVSEDCISRKWLEEHKEVISYKNEWYETEIDECVFWKNIENAPSVLPKRPYYRCGLREDCEDSTERKPKEGEWYRQTTDHFDYWECSECGIGVGLDDIKNYCPSCGAKMKGADDD